MRSASSRPLLSVSDWRADCVWTDSDFSLSNSARSASVTGTNPPRASLCDFRDSSLS